MPLTVFCNRCPAYLADLSQVWITLISRGGEVNDGKPFEPNPGARLLHHRSSSVPFTTCFSTLAKSSFRILPSTVLIALGPTLKQQTPFAQRE